MLIGRCVRLASEEPETGLNHSGWGGDGRNRRGGGSRLWTEQGRVHFGFVFFLLLKSGDSLPPSSTPSGFCELRLLSGLLAADPVTFSTMRGRDQALYHREVTQE